MASTSNPVTKPSTFATLQHTLPPSHRSGEYLHTSPLHHTTSSASTDSPISSVNPPCSSKVAYRRGQRRGG
ncbi:MAG: hypothetical protein Q9184_007580, partial [Pyrenodesmia sp. 2 TL-2023]